MNNLPKISCYGEYSSSNYGLNTIKIDLGSIELYYSYETIVAFWTRETGLVCSTNRWSVTTGKHLNWIMPNKNKRTPYSEFCDKLQEALSNHIQ